MGTSLCDRNGIASRWDNVTTGLYSLECTLPPGSGTLVGVFLVLAATGETTSTPKYLLSYGGGEITRLESEGCVAVSDLTLTGCQRAEQPRPILT